MAGLIRNILDSKYNGSFTLLDAINDSNIYEKMEKFYVPRVEIKDSIFIKKDESIAVTDIGPKRIRFIYLDSHGRNNTNPDSSYIQIPNNCNGFLARLSVSGLYYTAENLELDYLVDISNIKYRIDTTMMADNGNILMNDIIHFENLEIYEYPRIEFDKTIRDFMLHKDELFRTYFR